MNVRAAGLVLMALVLIAPSSPGSEPSGVAEEAAQKDKPKPPDKEKRPVEPPKTDIFTDAPVLGPQFATGFHPQMMGDFPGAFVRRFITVAGTQTITNTINLRAQIVNVTGLGAPVIITAPNHGLVNGQIVTVAGVLGNNAANGTYRVNVIDANRFAPANGIIGNGNFNPASNASASATTTATNTVPVVQQRSVVSFAFASGALKVADNESPRPQDRVFFTYNYFGLLRAPGFQPSTGTIVTQSTTGTPQLNTTTVTATTFANLPPVSANLHREVFGIEKTFLDGNASIELRLPLLQQYANIDAFSAQAVGDFTILGKYALINNLDTGNVFSFGLAITTPTGPAAQTSDGNIHSTWLQPFVGYIVNRDRFFLHAFHAIAVPTDARDVTMLFNDVGLNFWLYRTYDERALRFIVPMVEAHVTTPLNHRDMTGPVFVPDFVVLTSGVHLGLFRNGTLSVGVATPVSGPRIFNIEAFAQLNWRY